jgi:hypothetical protein
MAESPLIRADPVATTVSPARVAGVTAGLAIAGAVSGAVVADVVLATALLVTQGPGAVFRDWLVYFVGGAVGGGCGLICGPIAAWTLLRNVPLGRAILEPSIGAAIGGALGLFFAEPGGIFAPIGGAIAGLLLAAMRLRYEYRSRA